MELFIPLCCRVIRIRIDVKTSCTTVNSYDSDGMVDAKFKFNLKAVGCAVCLLSIWLCHSFSFSVFFFLRFSCFFLRNFICYHFMSSHTAPTNRPTTIHGVRIQLDCSIAAALGLCAVCVYPFFQLICLRTHNINNFE